MDPEITLMQEMAAQLEQFGPKTAAKVAEAIDAVMLATTDVPLEARVRASSWAMMRAHAALETASKAAKAADEPEAVDPPPKRKIVDSPQASGASTDGVMEQLRAGQEVPVDTVAATESGF